MSAAEYILLEETQRFYFAKDWNSSRKATSRFLLDLQAIPAAQEMTHLPVVVDPSHATFWRPWVAPMALAGIAAGADGVMLEVHPDPENAAVDPLQAINYQHFSELMTKMQSVSNAIGRSV